MRRRSALLEAMELLRSVNPDFTVSQLLALLYIADEAEPVPLPDLRRRAGMSSDGAWKSVQALTEIEDPDGDPLVTVDRWAMRAIVAAELGPAGRRLREALDQIIGDATPIAVEQSLPEAELRGRASGRASG
jgi:hypothetical protein